MVKPVKFICGLSVESNSEQHLYPVPIFFGKTVDVICTRRNTDMTIQTLRQCRSEESSNSIWQIVSAMCLKIRRWLTNLIELRGGRALRQTPLRSLQDFVGDHVQDKRG